MTIWFVTQQENQEIPLANIRYMTRGRVLTWEDDPANLARILVKARVTNLEDVPRHIVFSETDGFQGQSWTIQCEIIHQAMLGAQRSDEDPAPDNDPQVLNDPPFDFFDLGQQAQHDPFNNVDQDMEEEPHDVVNWGQWLNGAPDAAPAAGMQNGHAPIINNAPDLNEPLADEENQAMVPDLNVVLGENQDFPIPNDQPQLSCQLSDGGQGLASKSSVDNSQLPEVGEDSDLSQNVEASALLCDTSCL
jgi:hypothetical protein